MEDKSGIGVHGTAVRCKRRGLKTMLSARAKEGEGLMRLDVSRDPVVMLDAALQEASRSQEWN